MVPSSGPSLWSSQATRESNSGRQRKPQEATGDLGQLSACSRIHSPVPPDIVSRHVAAFSLFTRLGRQPKNRNASGFNGVTPVTFFKKC